jgi:hypothetical protein
MGASRRGLTRRHASPRRSWDPRNGQCGDLDRGAGLALLRVAFIVTGSPSCAGTASTTCLPVSSIKTVSRAAEASDACCLAQRGCQSHRCRDPLPRHICRPAFYTRAGQSPRDHRRRSPPRMLAGQRPRPRLFAFHGISHWELSVGAGTLKVNYRNQGSNRPIEPSAQRCARRQSSVPCADGRCAHRQFAGRQQCSSIRPRSTLHAK